MFSVRRMEGIGMRTDRHRCRSRLACRPSWYAALLCVLSLAVSCCSSEGTSHGASRATAAPSEAALKREGLIVPVTYTAACAPAVEAPICARGLTGPVPSALRRPVRFPHLGPGASCPATHGRPTKNPVADGVAMGDGPVRALLATAGDLNQGIADLDATPFRGWRLVKTEWFILPSYRGPVSIRAMRLDGSTPIRLGGSGSLPSLATPIVVPPGPTANTVGGWRAIPSGTWSTSAGCFGFEVDGLSFQELIVFRGELFR